MAAYSVEEEQRRKRRKRLLQGVLVGGAAIGIPALANLLISKRAGKLAPPSWGRAQRYNWRLGDIAYQRLGDGPPVVLLHSFGPGHHCGEWQIAAEILAERHTVFAPDLLTGPFSSSILFTPPVESLNEFGDECRLFGMCR